MSTDFSDSLPQRLQFMLMEVTTACNLRCPGCRRTNRREDGEWSSRFMDLATARKVLDNFPPISHLIVSGFGEVAFNPDLPEILAYARDCGKFRIIQINTNGLARDADYYRMLIEHGLNYLMVSVDTLDQGIADQVRTGTDVNRLRRLLHDLATFRIPVIVSITVSKENLEGLPSLLREINDIGKFTVGVREIGDMGQPERLLDSDGEIRLARLLMESLPLPNLRIAPPKCLQAKEARCVDPWLRPGVTVDGYLTPCCWTNDADLFQRLSMVDMTWEEAWHQPQHLEWLRTFREAPPENPCKGCTRDPRQFGGLWQGSAFELYRTLD